MLSQENAAWFEHVARAPEYAGLIVDPSTFIEKGTYKAIAGAMAIGATTTAQTVMDAASIVFAHAVLDDVALDFCRLTMPVAPQTWAELLKDRKVTLADAMRISAADLLSQLCEARLEQLRRESLLKKFDTILECCKPGPDWERFTDGTKYERTRLERFDKLRHDLVHGPTLQISAPDVEAELWYVMRLPMALAMLLARTFLLGVTEDEWMHAMQGVTKGP